MAIRPDYHEIRAGLSKARSAIENSLSVANGFDFLQMKDVIDEIVESNCFPFDEKDKKEANPREILESFSFDFDDAKDAKVYI